jgi:hypothetical protein
MSFIDTLKADFAKVGDAIVSLFTSIKGKLETFFENGAAAIAASITKQLPQAEQDIVDFIKQAALDAVAAAETIPGGGVAKMTAAIAALGADLAGKGITLAETELRALLENALLLFKAEQAPTAAAPAAAS